MEILEPLSPLVNGFKNLSILRFDHIFLPKQKLAPLSIKVLAKIGYKTVGWFGWKAVATTIDILPIAQVVPRIAIDSRASRCIKNRFELLITQLERPLRLRKIDHPAPMFFQSSGQQFGATYAEVKRPRIS